MLQAQRRIYGGDIGYCPPLGAEGALTRGALIRDSALGAQGAAVR